MIKPPTTELSPWQPGLWITQTGYALNELDVRMGNKGNPLQSVKMLAATKETTQIMEKVMSK